MRCRTTVRSHPPGPLGLLCPLGLLSHVALAALLLLASPAQAQPAATVPPVPPDAALLGCQQLHLEAQQLFEAAQRSNDAATFAQAGRAYRTLYQRALQSEPSDPSRCARLDETLLTAAVAFRRAGEAAHAIVMLRQLAELQPPTRLTGTGLEQLGQAWLALCSFSEAARAFERLSEVAPNESSAPDGLENAIVLRLALSDRAQAVHNAERFEKLYGARQLGEVAKIALAVAEAVSEAEERGEQDLSPAEVTKLVDHAVDLTSRTRELGLELRARAVAARRLAGKDDHAARDQAETIVRMQRAGVLEQLASNAPAAGGLLWLGRALTAVGEAHFVLARMADRARKDLPAPKLARRVRGAAIGTFLKTRVEPWLAQRRAAQESSEQGYRPILAIPPVPPPRWVVEASGEVALGWIGLQKEIDTLASQIAVAGDREHAQALRQSTDVVTQRAKAAARTYLDLRAKLQTTSEHATNIEAWLAHAFPREHPLLEEFVPEARWTPSELPPTAPLGPPATLAPPATLSPPATLGPPAPLGPPRAPVAAPHTP